MSMRNTLLNVGISIYNRSAGLCGAAMMKYKPIIPKFDPFETSHLIWKVQGHQLLVEGFFSTDSHPGNYLIDEGTGRLGLIDFEQVCEISLELRVRFSRLILALTE